MDLEWSEKYSIGVDEIDVQHKRFFFLMTKLFNSTNKDLDKLIIEELYKYTEYHFDSEEKMMLIYDYKDLFDQRAAHKGLLQRLILETNPVEGIEFDKGKFLAFLVKWLWSHITIDDMKLGEYIQEKRL